MSSSGRNLKEYKAEKIVDAHKILEDNKDSIWKWSGGYSSYTLSVWLYSACLKKLSDTEVKNNGLICLVLFCFGGNLPKAYSSFINFLGILYGYNVFDHSHSYSFP